MMAVRVIMGNLLGTGSENLIDLVPVGDEPAAMVVGTLVVFRGDLRFEGSEHGRFGGRIECERLTLTGI